MGRYKTSDLQTPKQHHRSRSWRPQVSLSSHPRLSDDEDRRYDQGLGSDAYDPSRALLGLDSTGSEKGSLRQLSILGRGAVLGPKLT